MKRWLGLIAFGIAISIGNLYSHHSIAGVYDSSRTVSIEGVVAQFHFVNPHPFVMVEVRAERGKPQQWRLEMDNRFELVEVGMNDQTLKPGDRVVVTGSPGRSQPQSLYIRKLERPVDGFEYEQVGSSPRIRTK
jgi:uncharacterized protein DUF6152